MRFHVWLQFVEQVFVLYTRHWLHVQSDHALATLLTTPYHVLFRDFPHSWWVLSMSWCCPSRLCMVHLTCMHLALFLELSLSLGNSSAKTLIQTPLFPSVLLVLSLQFEHPCRKRLYIQQLVWRIHVCKTQKVCLCSGSAMCAWYMDSKHILGSITSLQNPLQPRYVFIWFVDICDNVNAMLDICCAHNMFNCHSKSSSME